MNTGTGHLISAEAMERLRKADAAAAASYTEVPRRLSRAARMKLAGVEAAMVSLTSGGRLSQWAAQERAKAAKARKRTAAKKRSRRQMAKASRKANRT